MKLNKGCKEEYAKRHGELWPELAAVIKAGGVSDYSIFYDQETDILFGIQKVEGDGGSQELAGEEVVRKWWKYMADIMETNPDDSPVSIPLEELFYFG